MEKQCTFAAVACIPPNLKESEGHLEAWLRAQSRKGRRCWLVYCCPADRTFSLRRIARIGFARNTSASATSTPTCLDQGQGTSHNIGLDGRLAMMQSPENHTVQVQW